MIIKTPTTWFFGAGSAEGWTELNAFDNALCAAGVGNTNLVKMSSILPPHCEQIPPVKLPLGALVPVAYASMTCDQSGQTVAAAVAIAFPTDPELNGLIMEVHGVGTKEEFEKKVREMAISGFEARGYRLKEIRSCAAEATCKGSPVAAFASVVLWD